MKLSTALCAHLMGIGSLKQGLTGLVCTLYSGTAPASADAALNPDNVPLCVVSVGGNGVNFESDVSGGALIKSASEVWQGTNIAGGVASFFRLQSANDDGVAATSRIRLQGSMALINADLNASSTSLVSGETFKINSCVLSVVAG